MAKVVIYLGSEKSDWPLVQQSKMLEILKAMGVEYDVISCSAHRNPWDLMENCESQTSKGVKVFIGIAAMAAALPGAIAALTSGCYLVLGVPLESEPFGAQDSTLAMIRMPPGRPVNVSGVGKIGLDQAAITACQALSLGDPEIGMRLVLWQKENTPETKYLISSEERS